jgi:hypothetical protein
MFYKLHTHTTTIKATTIKSISKIWHNYLPFCSAFLLLEIESENILQQ